ncbi:MAG: hypothetical protein MPK62_13380 [Alphaproteobacteria bacterium]|nr:hypothetical protein [Alphaproteobacteria bacterium]
MTPPPTMTTQAWVGRDLVSAIASGLVWKLIPGAIEMVANLCNDRIFRHTQFSADRTVVGEVATVVVFIEQVQIREWNPADCVDATAMALAPRIFTNDRDDNFFVDMRKI